MIKRNKIFPYILLLMTAALVLIHHIPAVIRLFRGTEPRLSLEKDITYKLDQ